MGAVAVLCCHFYSRNSQAYVRVGQRLNFTLSGSAGLVLAFYKTVVDRFIPQQTLKNGCLIKHLPTSLQFSQ